MTSPTIQIIQPKNETDWLALRAQDVTSTESAALFNASPYLTRFELWHRKRDGVIVTLDPNERIKWGTRLQDTIAKGVAEDHGWTIRRMDEYCRDPKLRMGSSFDFRVISGKEGFATDYSYDLKDCPSDSLLEIKNVDALQFRDGWLVNGDDIEAPPHIEIQVQHQLAVSGLDMAYIAALVGGNAVKVIERRRDERMIGVIRAKVGEFWESVDNNLAPSPDWSRDSKAVIRMYSYAEPGRIFDARNDAEVATLVQEYIGHADAEKTAKAGKETAKAQILQRIGEAEKVLGEGWTISAGLVGPAHVEYEREGYRGFRVNRPRGKK